MSQFPPSNGGTTGLGNISVICTAGVIPYLTQSATVDSATLAWIRSQLQSIVNIGAWSGYGAYSLQILGDESQPAPILPGLATTNMLVLRTGAPVTIDNQGNATYAKLADIYGAPSGSIWPFTRAGIGFASYIISGGNRVFTGFTGMAYPYRFYNVTQYQPWASYTQVPVDIADPTTQDYAGPPKPGPVVGLGGYPFSTNRIFPTNLPTVGMYGAFYEFNGTWTEWTQPGGGDIWIGTRQFPFSIAGSIIFYKFQLGSDTFYAY